VRIELHHHLLSGLLLLLLLLRLLLRLRLLLLLCLRLRRCCCRRLPMMATTTTTTTTTMMVVALQTSRTLKKIELCKYHISVGNDIPTNIVLVFLLLLRPRLLPVPPLRRCLRRRCLCHCPRTLLP
jgi:hypothetical protein